MARERWKKVRRLKTQIVLVLRWHRGVKGIMRRMWLAFRSSHTLLAGVAFKGTLGYSRAQTVQILLNSVALELVVLCMFYSGPSSGPVVINPVKIFASGCLAALICIPGMLICAWLFTPVVFVRLLRALLLLPWRLARAILRCTARCFIGAARGGSSSASKPPRDALANGNVRQPPPPVGDLKLDSIHAIDDVEAALAAEAKMHPKRPAPIVPPLPCEADEAELIVPLHERKFSYASLDEHLLRQSLRRSLQRRDWRSAANIALGWALNWALTLTLMSVFTLYGCELIGTQGDSQIGQQIVLSWCWSLFQRFIINEPMLIFIATGAPALFATECCANMCTESCSTCLGLFVEAIKAFMQTLR